MKSKTARLIVVPAGALLAVAVTTGSTQAQQQSAPSGSFTDALTSWVKPAPVRSVPAHIERRMCEESMDITQPSKG